MGIILNGSKPSKIIYNGAESALYFNGSKIWPEVAPDPYNPLNLPPYTIRLLYKDGVTPNFSYGTGVQVSQSPNVWDLTYNNTDWGQLLRSHSGLLEVLGANTSGVTKMGGMFRDCSYLTTVPLFDTSSVINMSYMFYYCSRLTTVSLFDTSSVTNMSDMFYFCSRLTTIPLFNTSSATNVAEMFFYCGNVESGALALYQQMSTQATPPSNHNYTFYNCGMNTVTGAAELAQIPSDWK